MRKLQDYSLKNFDKDFHLNKGDISACRLNLCSIFLNAGINIYRVVFSIFLCLHCVMVSDQHDQFIELLISLGQRSPNYGKRTGYSLRDYFIRPATCYGNKS